MKERIPESYGQRFENNGRITTPPLRRICRFAVQSIRLRLGRCLVTMASVISAIAFLNFNALQLRDNTEDAASSSGVELHEGAVNSGADADFFAGLAEFTADRNVREKRLFVVFLSILVCFTGITNSMLMSIRERYREIATLKCLGAINQYIRRLFVIESLLQGALGSVLGVLGGSLLYCLAFDCSGALMWILGVGAVCIVMGLIMTLGAAVWPIREALAMLPIEALRVEE